jgi:ubiquitin carboxyl-terminal hydrolase 7
MARVLPKDPELETEAETHHTWHITDWRKLRRKEHGPVFECAGFPWFV